MKKVISIILTVCTVLCYLSCLGVGASVMQTSADSGVVIDTDAWYDAEADVLYIDNAKELLEFAAILGASNDTAFEGKTIKLRNDIDLNPDWDASAGKMPPTIWPASKSYFNGATFDGCGFTIKGIYQQPDSYARLGIFGGVSGSGVNTTVKNLRIENSYSECASNDGHGFLFGYITSNASVTVENVYLDVRMKNTATADGKYLYGIGGFIGGVVYLADTAKATESTITLRNCIYKGSIKIGATTGYSYVGGLIGRYNEDTLETIENCGVYCSVEGGSTGTTMIGGLIGYQSAASTTVTTDRKVTLKNCISDITNTVSGTTKVGAACGAARYNSASVYSQLEVDSLLYKGSYGLLGCIFNQGGSTTSDSNSTALSQTSCKNVTAFAENDLSEGWELVDSYPIPSALIFDKEEATFVTGLQPSKLSASDTTFDIRLIGVIKAENESALSGYDKVGFRVKVNYKDSGESVYRELNAYDVTNVYTSILALEGDEETAYTNEGLGGYFFVMPCRNLPLYSGEMEVEVTTYYTVGDSTVDGRRYFFNVETDIIPQFEGSATGASIIAQDRVCTSEGDTQTVYEGGTVADYNSYKATLEAAGFTKRAENTLNGENYFSTYTNGNAEVRLSWFEDLKRFQIIVGDLGYLPSTEQSATSTLKAPKVTQLARTGIDDGGPGMLFVIQAEDGSYFVIDGGLNNSTDKATLLKFLEDNKPATHEKPHVTWMFTHQHSDHMALALEFMKEYHENIQLDMVCYNFPEVDVLNWGHTSIYSNKNQAKVNLTQLKTVLNEYYEDTETYIFHTGDKLYFAGGEIEFLFTPEDYIGSAYSTLNELNSVWRFKFDSGNTFLVMGDAEEPISNQLAEMYGSYLKSDVFQPNHHGQHGGTAALYQHIAPKYVLWANSEFNCITTPENDTRTDNKGDPLTDSAANYPIHWSGRDAFNKNIMFDTTADREHFHGEQTATIDMDSLQVTSGVVSFWPLS